jgi:hypothetical protein
MVNLWLLNALLIHNPRTDPFLTLILVTNGKDRLGGRIILQLRLVNLQPETLRALAVGDDLGLG